MSETIQSNIELAHEYLQMEMYYTAIHHIEVAIRLKKKDEAIE